MGFKCNVKGAPSHISIPQLPEKQAPSLPPAPSPSHMHTHACTHTRTRSVWGPSRAPGSAAARNPYAVRWVRSPAQGACGMARMRDPHVQAPAEGSSALSTSTCAASMGSTTALTAGTAELPPRLRRPECFGSGSCWANHLRSTSVLQGSARGCSATHCGHFPSPSCMTGLLLQQDTERRADLAGAASGEQSWWKAEPVPARRGRHTAWGMCVCLPTISVPTTHGAGGCPPRSTLTPT